ARLPDVSYVRANLPMVQGRLDAWCGLAKHTLIRYEAASGANLYGDFSIGERAFVRIPKWEPIELLLLATPNLAEGILDVAEGPSLRHAGRNHMANAGLRSAYPPTPVPPHQPPN